APPSPHDESASPSKSPEPRRSTSQCLECGSCLCLSCRAFPSCGGRIHSRTLIVSSCSRQNVALKPPKCSAGLQTRADQSAMRNHSVRDQGRSSHFQTPSIDPRPPQCLC